MQLDNKIKQTGPNVLAEIRQEFTNMMNKRDKAHDQRDRDLYDKIMTAVGPREGQSSQDDVMALKRELDQVQERGTLNHQKILELLGALERKQDSDLSRVFGDLKRQLEETLEGQNHTLTRKIDQN